MWLVAARRASCRIGSMTRTRDPTPSHRRRTEASARRSVCVVRVRMQIDCSKRSPLAARIPRCSDPARGCAPINRTDLPRRRCSLCRRRSTFRMINPLLLPTSVRTAPGRITIDTVGARPQIVLTGNANTTMSASHTASFIHVVPRSMAPRDLACRSRCGRSLHPTTWRARWRRLIAMPSDPPINPSPRMVTRSKRGSVCSVPDVV